MLGALCPGLALAPMRDLVVAHGPFTFCTKRCSRTALHITRLYTCFCKNRSRVPTMTKPPKVPSQRRYIAPKYLGLDPIEEHEEAGAWRHLLDYVDGAPE